MVLYTNKATQFNYGGKTIKDFHLKRSVVYKTENIEWFMRT